MNRFNDYNEKWYVIGTLIGILAGIAIGLLEFILGIMGLFLWFILTILSFDFLFRRTRKNRN